MNFDDLKEQFLEKWDEAVSQLQDSPAFNTLKEKFENLNPNAQKGFIWGGVVFVSLMLFSCPMSFWSKSSENIVIFEEKRAQVRDLLRASHMANQTSNLPAPMNTGAMTSRVQSIVTSAGLLPEQNLGVKPVDAKLLGAPLAPPNILQEAVEISLGKLNLTQVVDIGYQLQSMNDAVKLAGLDVAANPENDHYFDVKYSLIKFSIPQEPSTDEKDKRKKRRRGDD